MKMKQKLFEGFYGGFLGSSSYYYIELVDQTYLFKKFF